MISQIRAVYAGGWLRLLASFFGKSLEWVDSHFAFRKTALTSIFRQGCVGAATGITVREVSWGGGDLMCKILGV
jgi:hypothetical protein